MASGTVRPPARGERAGRALTREAASRPCASGMGAVVFFEFDVAKM